MAMDWINMKNDFLALRIVLQTAIQIHSQTWKNFT
jgi:hypothetical protein